MKMTTAVPKSTECYWDVNLILCTDDMNGVGSKFFPLPLVEGERGGGGASSEKGGEMFLQT